MAPCRGCSIPVLPVKDDALSSKHKNLKFIVVGEASRGEDEYANSIKSLAEKLGLKNILFDGFRSDTPDVLSAFDIFIFRTQSVG